MKKIPLLLLALFLVCSSFTERGPSPFIPNFTKEDHGTTIYFVFYHPDEHDALQKLEKALGKPASNTAGIIEWKNIDIGGIADKVTITIKDGILTHDTATRRACWVTFRSEQDKKERLAHMTADQSRETQIEIADKNGRHFVSNGVIEHRLQAFLEASIQF